MEIEILKAIQSMANPFFDLLFQIITALGESMFAILIVAYFYWCRNKEGGRRLMFTMGLATCINGALKGLVCRPRPSEADGIRKLRQETATGSSFPSGHSQNVAALLTALSLEVKKTWLWILSAFIMLLVGFSRLYLGAHFPTDVLAGLVLGVLTALLVSFLMKKFAKPGHQAPLMLICSALFLPFAIYFGFFVSPEKQALQNDFFKAFGLLAGISVGTLLEEKLVSFSTDCVSAKHQALRMILGILVVAPVYLLCKFLFPAGVFFSALRYFLVALSAVYCVPALFGVCRL